jgi:hypothetical protein
MKLVHDQMIAVVAAVGGAPGVDHVIRECFPVSSQVIS